MKVQPRNPRNVIIITTMIVGSLILLIVAFLTGTVVGFNTAMKSLSGCEQRPCVELGINASLCEICPETQGYQILKVR